MEWWPSGSSRGSPGPTRGVWGLSEVTHLLLALERHDLLPPCRCLCEKETRSEPQWMEVATPETHLMCKG